MPNIRPQTEYSACDYRSDELAKEMLANIIGEKSFDIDDIEWDDTKITVPEDLMSKWQTDVDPVTIDELTERKVKGSGVFDAMMHAIRVHLKEEYDNNRITGAEYATTYTRLTEAALGNAVQFCLQKNQAYFQGILAQAQAITAGINAQIAALTAKVQLAKVKAEALGVAAQYALTAMKLSTEDAQHALICRQQDVTTAQIAQTEAQTNLINAQVATQTEQAALIHAQTVTQGEQSALVHNQSTVAKYQAEMLNPKPALTDKDTDGDYTNIDYQNKKQQVETAKNQAVVTKYQAMANNPKPSPADAGTNIDFLIKESQNDQLQKNIDHIDNQMEVEDAQKELYAQQKISFIRKSERDVADLFSNAYLAMKSVDEGLAIPKAFSGASINEVLQTLKANVDLGEDSTNITSYNISGSTFTGRSDIPESGTKADRAYLQNGVLRSDASGDNKEPEE